MGDSSNGVELQVANIDPGIDARDIRQLVTSLFSECVSVGGVSVYQLEGGGLGAVVRVAGTQEAQLAISQLHKRKVGTKRISITLLPADGAAALPRKEVASLLKSVPGEKIQLFKFRQIYEERFRCSISVAELHRMRDLVSLTEEAPGLGRMVGLRPGAGLQQGDTVEPLYCPAHCPDLAGWAGRAWEGLPDVVVGLDSLQAGVERVLRSHNGVIPLASFIHCYQADGGTALQAADGEEGRTGVPLEHLLQALKGVLITTGSTGIKRLVEATPANSGVRHADLVGPPPALAGQLIAFTRDVVEMLKSLPGCRIAFYKFIPRYHHHFGKQCRVADYGYTKLRDLLESLPHVIQIVGEGGKTSVTLAHKAQVRRFTNDLLKMLKNLPDKQILLSEVPSIFEKTFYKPLNLYDYGVCRLADILADIPESTIVIEDVAGSDDKFISIFKRDQTQEEVIRTRSFAKEVVELLRHSPDLSISFNKFIPAYHQHFGRQCRVGSYGMTKLIELFEAVPDTVEVREEGEERLVQLTVDKMIWVIGEQVECVVKSSRSRCVPLAELETEYQKTYGHLMPLGRLGVCRVEQAVALLQSWVRTQEGREGIMVVTVDRGFIRTMASNVRRLLVEQDQGTMDLEDFIEAMATGYGSHIEMEMLTRDLSYLVEVRAGEVALTALQLCARDIEVVLGEMGRLPVAELESQYEAKFGRELPLEPLGFESVSELLNAMNDTLSVRGRGIRKIVSVNKSPSASLVSPSRPSSLVLPPVMPAPARVGSVATFSGRGFDMIRAVPPQTVSRSYSGVLQCGDRGMGRPAQLCPAPPPSLRFSVPPPNFLQHYPPPLVDNSQSNLVPSRIPTAAPGSPATPTTPRSSINFPFSLYGFYPPKPQGSPVIRSPLPTFQQHMLHHSPSPLITPSKAPYIVQPISRSSPQVGFQVQPGLGDQLALSLNAGLGLGQMETKGSKLETSFATADGLASPTRFMTP